MLFMVWTEYTIASNERVRQPWRQCPGPLSCHLVSASRCAAFVHRWYDHHYAKLHTDNSMPTFFPSLMFEVVRASCHVERLCWAV